MRNIEFRGKRKDNGEWIYGDLWQYESGAKAIFDYEIKSIISVIPETVGQYTGLTDKNKKKIFEGDVVIDKYDCEKFGFVGVVKYNENHSAFEIKNSKKPDYIANLGSRINSVKIIGNIFDNPELLKGGE